MNSKAWLTVFGVFSVLLLGGAGFYAFSSYGKYSEAMDGWNSKVSTIESLERRVPYPNEDNVEELQKKVSTYKEAVASLSETLKSFQRPLDTVLANTEFQVRVKKRVEDFRVVSKEGGLEISPDLDFQLGFNTYANVVPAQELVPVLDYELEAIDHLLRTLIACGAKELVAFDRDAIPGEAGGAEKQESGVVDKYPVRLRFNASHGAFQQFINEVANDRQFFYIVRVLKINSELKEGPLKLTEEGSGFVKYENPVTKEVAGPDKLAEWGRGTAPEAEVEAKAREAGFIKADQDARVLMGQENLNVFLVVDITRFLSPEEVKATTPEPEAKKGKK
ncbi:MAG: Amuc_1100 family pilus-like protein [Verrucomicrobiae bacterium]|nr:Amuc_1100 family pilus-like protein [Verrucomicrobiae bacterium]